MRCKMWSGPEHDSDVHGDWSVQQTLAQHVSEHAAHKRTSSPERPARRDRQTKTTRGPSSFDEHRSEEEVRKERTHSG